MSGVYRLMKTSFKDSVAGLRLSFRWLGLTRALEEEHLSDFYENMQSDPRATTTKKKIINPKNEHYKNLNTIRQNVYNYVKQVSLPYIEKGVRLVSRERLIEIKQTLEKYREDLKVCEQEFENQKEAILADARSYLGKLYNPSNYPNSFIGLFDFSFEPINLEPPSYLMELDSKEYERLIKQQEEKILTSFKLYDEQLGEMFLEMVQKLVEQLKPTEEGHKKKLHSSAFNNLDEFFTKYKEFRQGLAKELREDNEIDSTVEKAKKVLDEFDIDGVKTSQKIRNQLQEKLIYIEKSLSNQIVTKNKRFVKVKDGV